MQKYENFFSKGKSNLYIVSEMDKDYNELFRLLALIIRVPVRPDAGNRRIRQEPVFAS